MCSEGWSGIDCLFQEGGKGARRSHEMYVTSPPPRINHFPPPRFPVWVCLLILTTPISFTTPSRESTSYCCKSSYCSPPTRASASNCSRSARATLISDLVYNSRKRGGDSADRYFKATEMIAGVKDMRFQAIMPDTLHWLGVQKIDNMISMVRPFLHHLYLKIKG
jgi:hypothetical protein